MQTRVKLFDTIELRHIRYFLAVIEHGSFRKAGTVLGKSQPAVSRCMADLEDQIGASLFHRHTWGVSPTYAGHRFLVHAHEAIRAIGKGTCEVGAIGKIDNGMIRIGLNSSIASGFLAKLLRSYSERYGSVRLVLIDGDPAEHVAAIRQMRLDVAFINGARDWLNCERTPLWSERVYVVMPDHHHLASCSELTWQDLSHECFVLSECTLGMDCHTNLVNGLAGLGQFPNVQVQSVGRDNLLPLVAIGRRLTLVSEAMTATRFPGVAYRPISGEFVPFSAVWSHDNDNPAFRRFISMAKAASQEIISGIADRTN